jgi:tetratricopeptide (TPR) repeat protein
VIAMTVAALVAGLGLGAPESAVEPTASEAAESTDDLDEAARAAYEARDYDTAIQLFERALEDTGDPNYLFNIGRVHEEAGRLELAVSFYERFLDQGEVALEARAATLERVKVLRGVIEERARAEKTDAPPEEDATPPHDADLEPTSTASVDDIYEQKRRKRLMVAGSVLTGIGGAALVAGAVMAGLAQRQANILDNELVALEDRRRRIDAAETYAVAADGLFIAGGVVAATGLALVITAAVGKRRSTRSTAYRWRLDPQASRRSIGLSIHGRF